MRPLAAIRRTIPQWPFHGDGRRKVWARLRVREVRTSMRPVLRLLRENCLLDFNGSRSMPSRIA